MANLGTDRRRTDVTEFAAMRHLFLSAATLLIAVTAHAQAAPAPSRVEGPDGAAWSPAGSDTSGTTWAWCSSPVPGSCSGHLWD